MSPDDFGPCCVCDCDGCDRCVQATVMYDVDPADLACSCGSDS